MVLLLSATEENESEKCVIGKPNNKCTFRTGGVRHFRIAKKIHVNTTVNGANIPCSFYLISPCGHETNQCIQTFKGILYYKHSKPPTCKCFGHSCGHPHGDVLKRTCYNNFKNQYTNAECFKIYIQM
jgi:hypothetical protein